MLGYRRGRMSFGKGGLAKVVWATDNGCYTNPDIDVTKYLRWLRSLREFRETCLFATAPDVVADAKATWDRSQEVLPRIRELGYPAAFVAQDGIESTPIPWNSFDCLFVGGSTEWELSSSAFWLCREAAKSGKWVHMGRVNSFQRLLLARFAGCHSTDGTGLAFAPDKRLAQLEKWLDFIQAQPVLNF